MPIVGCPPPCPRPRPWACCSFLRGSSLSSVLSFQVPPRFLMRGRLAAGTFAAGADAEPCAAGPGSGPGGAWSFVFEEKLNEAKTKAAMQLIRENLALVVITDGPYYGNSQEQAGKFPAESRALWDGPSLQLDAATRD